MKVEFKNKFIKIYNKRIAHQPKLQEKFFDRTRLFSSNPGNPILSDHLLRGNKEGLRAFSITGDIRVIYIIHHETAFFVDIGTHNQVY